MNPQLFHIKKIEKSVQKRTVITIFPEKSVTLASYGIVAGRQMALCFRQHLGTRLCVCSQNMYDNANRLRLPAGEILEAYRQSG